MEQLEFDCPNCGARLPMRDEARPCVECGAMPPSADAHDHCESCGIRIPLLPEDASADERLCDRCHGND